MTFDDNLSEGRDSDKLYFSGFMSDGNQLQQECMKKISKIITLIK